jgi:hypothetical protein
MAPWALNVGVRHGRSVAYLRVTRVSDAPRDSTFLVGGQRAFRHGLLPALDP